MKHSSTADKHSQKLEKPVQFVKSNFLVLECKPEDSNHPQGNRVLECIEFSPTNFRIKGQPRFDKFKAVLSMPQDGSRLETEVQVVSSCKDCFEVKLINPSASISDKIAWWFSKDIDFVEKPSKRTRIPEQTA